MNKIESFKSAYPGISERAISIGATSSHKIVSTLVKGGNVTLYNIEKIETFIDDYPQNIKNNGR